MSSATISTSLVEAINFLTRPLALTVPTSTISSLQQILLSTLTTVPAWVRNSRLTLTFASTAPPRAIYAACIAANLDWSEWFYALGGREFDLTIERNSVSVQVSGIPERVVVWKQPPPVRATFIPTIALSEPDPKVQLPNSRFSQSVQLTKAYSSPTTTYSTLANTQPKTLAQQLLQSEHEKEEADEIFAMISNLDACLISPTPTRECFSIPKAAPMARAHTTCRFTRLSALEEEIFHSGSCFRQTGHIQDPNTPSPVSSPESSRPSSPSSTFSYSSSQESLTSISTTSSTTTSSPGKISRKPFVTPAPVKCSTPVVDTTKKEVQRYLYQGGQSTVLTGGVMLGAPAKAAAPLRSSPAIAPKYRAPVRGKKNLDFARAKAQSQTSSGPSSASWRRAIVSRI